MVSPLNGNLCDKLDEFLNEREHDRIMEAKWNPKTTKDIVVVKGKVQTAKEQALCLKGVM